MRGFLLSFALGIFYLTGKRQKALGGGGKRGGGDSGGSGGNIGGYIGGKKHKPPFPLSRRFKMALTLDPSDTQF